ncbi:MAG: hypothetical protein R2909_14100 [Gemmatimonadales bacterium]
MNLIAHLDDPAPVDHQLRGAALDGDPVLLDLAHLADHAAGGDHDVVLLQALKHGLMPLPGLALGPDDQEVEDRAERGDLDQRP